MMDKKNDQITEMILYANFIVWLNEAVTFQVHDLFVDAHIVSGAKNPHKSRSLYEHFLALVDSNEICI